MLCSEIFLFANIISIFHFILSKKKMLGFGKSLLMLFHFLAFFFSSFVYTLSSLCAQIQMLGFKDNSDCISKNYRCEGKHTWCFFFLCALSFSLQNSTFLGLILILLRIEPNDYIEISWDPSFWYRTVLLLLNEDVARSVAQLAKVRRLICMLWIHQSAVAVTVAASILCYGVCT